MSSSAMVAGQKRGFRRRRKAQEEESTVPTHEMVRCGKRYGGARGKMDIKYAYCWFDAMPR